LTREDRRSLALHRVIAERLREDPVTIVARARQSLHRMRALHSGAAPLLDLWSELLEHPLDEVVAVLADSSPHARALRAVTPFTGILSAAERALVYREFAQRERAMERARASARVAT
jgi:hypothetical protein